MDLVRSDHGGRLFARILALMILIVMHSKSNNSRRREVGRHSVGKAPAFVEDATVAHLLRPADVIEVISGAYLDPPSAPPRGVAETPEAGGRGALLAMPA